MDASKGPYLPSHSDAKQGKLQVNLEEARLGQGKDHSYIFVVGAGDGTGEVRDNLFGHEFSPADLDLFISLLTLARDKARELGMPSDQRGAEVTVSDFDQNEGCADKQRNPLPPATVRCRTIDGKADGVSLHLYETEPGNPVDLQLTIQVENKTRGGHAFLETSIHREQVASYYPRSTWSLWSKKTHSQTCRALWGDQCNGQLTMPDDQRSSVQRQPRPDDRLRVYTSSDGFFDGVVTFLISLSGIGVVTTMLAPNMPFSAPVPDQLVELSGVEHVSNSTFLIESLPIMQSIARNTWPNRIEIIERRGTFLSSKHQTQLTNFPITLGQQLIEPMYLQYFESNRPSGTLLPPVWEFGKVIRNACAHDGRIDIRNPNAAPVTWRTLTYSPTENGKRIWFVDLTAVEIILLMEDLDAALTEALRPDTFV